MNLKDLDKLAAKFFNGETTEQEEAQLKAFLMSNEVTGELKVLKEYFNAAEEIAGESLDDSFDDQLMARLQTDEGRFQTKRWLWVVSSAAAVIILALGFWFGSSLFQPKEVYGTIDDPVLAFQETRKALDEVSKKINKGLSPAKETVEKVEVNVNKAGDIKKIDKALKKTKNLNKLEQASDFLKSFSKVYVDYGNS